MKLCNIRHEPDSLFEGAIESNEGYVLLSGSRGFWNLRCDGGSSKTIRGCKLCLLKIPCGCEIASDSFILSARLTSCQTSREITMLYPQNVPSLYTFHNNSIWRAVTAVTAFSSPPVVELRPVTPTRNRAARRSRRPHEIHHRFPALSAEFQTESRLFPDSGGGP